MQITYRRTSGCLLVGSSFLPHMLNRIAAEDTHPISPFSAVSVDELHPRVELCSERAPHPNVISVAVKSVECRTYSA